MVFLMYIAVSIVMLACGDSSVLYVDTPEGTYPVQEYYQVETPVYGECYEVADGIYIENEGNRIDVFNNSLCDRSPVPFDDYCNNIYDNKVCVVDNYLIFPEGTYNRMLINVLRLL